MDRPDADDGRGSPPTDSACVQDRLIQARQNIPKTLNPIQDFYVFCIKSLVIIIVKDKFVMINKQGRKFTLTEEWSYHKKMAEKEKDEECEQLCVMVRRVL